LLGFLLVNKTFLTKFKQITKTRIFMKWLPSFFIWSLVLLAGNVVQAQPYQPNWESLDKRPVPAWFQDARFGIFIHWGVYSVPCWAPADADIGVYAKYAEWYWNRLEVDDGKAHKYFREHHDKVYGADFKYPDFAPLFKAEFFDPAQWADLFKKSGAKYVVLTSKHHEGFTLWPSAQSWNWNAVDIGPHRDLAGDLSKAVKEAGLHMGFYYSLYEWFNPTYLNNFPSYVDEHMIPQMNDLVTRYQPDLLWTDGEWEHSSHDWKSEAFLAWLYNESGVKDRVVVNDRWGNDTRSKHGGIYTTEYNLIDDKEFSGEIQHPIEECRGIGTSFGYNRIETGKNYMSSDALIELLIDKVSNGSNLLLDIGPTADGLIPVVMQERLLDMGKWLELNGEAIYGTVPWSKRPKELQKQGVWFTRKAQDLFVIFTKWPDTSIKINGIAKASSFELLGSDCKVQTELAKNTLTLTLPANIPVSVARNSAWVIKIKNFNQGF
jgi:alpha-L-fucosidase